MESTLTKKNLYFAETVKSGLEDLSDLFSSLSCKKYCRHFISVTYSLMLLLLGLILHNTGSYYITSENDFFSSYAPHAERLLNGNFIIDVYRGPLYVFLLALLKFIFNNYLTAGIIISALSSGFFLFFTFATLKNIFSSRLALVAVLLTAVNPLFIVYSYGAGTDMLFNFLCAAAVYFFIGSKNLNKTNIVIAGLFTGFAFLTRYNTIFLLLTIPALIFINRTIPGALKNKTAYFILFAAVFIATVSPWGIYTYLKKGEVFYNENYRNVAISLNGRESINWEEAWNKNSNRFNSLSEIIEEEPELFAKTISTNLLHHSYKNIVILNTLHVGIFSILGFLFMRRREIRQKQFSYYLINFAFFILLLPFFYDERFFLFLIPVLSLLAYFGLKTISDYSKFSWSLMFAALLCFSVLSTMLYNKKIITGQEEIKNVAASFFSKQIVTDEKNIVASRMPHIAYHLNMKWQELPLKKSLNETVNFLKKKRINYLYFSRREYNERIALRRLINPLDAPPALKAVVYLPEEHAILYKVN